MMSSYPHQFPSYVALPSAASIGFVYVLRITRCRPLAPHLRWRSPTKANTQNHSHVQWEQGRLQTLQVWYCTGLD